MGNGKSGIDDPDRTVEALPGGAVYAVPAPSPEPVRLYPEVGAAPQVGAAPPPQPGPPYVVEKSTEKCQLYLFPAAHADSARRALEKPALISSVSSARSPAPPPSPRDGLGSQPSRATTPARTELSPTPGRPAPTQIDGPRWPMEAAGTQLPSAQRPGVDLITAAPRVAGAGALLRQSSPEEQRSASPPPSVAPPLQRAAWSSEPAEGAPFSAGSFFHPGPPAAAADKGGNQDFAFHVDLVGPDGAAWLLFGVADGVSQATWSARAARHAAGAFIEAVHGFFGDPDFPRTEALLLGDRWPDPLTHQLYDRLMRRLNEDADFLLKGRYVDTTWTPTLFAQQFWEGPAAEQRVRTTWMQSTLLAVALGPHGGFALFLGDGFARVDREFANDQWESRPALEPTRQISMELTEAHVRNSVHRLPGKGALRLGVLVTTDGVSKSSAKGLSEAMSGLPVIPASGARSPLERVRFTSSKECELALDRLAALPPDLADVDNMSIAFGIRTLEPSGQRGL